MAEAKILAWIFYGLGIPIYGYAIFLNITNWKSDVLFVAALILVGVKTYYTIRKNEQAIRRENIELKKLEHDYEKLKK